MWKKRFPLMDQAGGGGGSGGAPAPTPAPAATPTPTPAASPTPTPAPTPAPAAAPAPSSVLATGATPTPTSPADFIPEKARVLKEDGSFDFEASSRKLAELYGNAEKRIGTGDLPPKEASEYVVTVPDALKEAFDPAKDEGMQAFLKDAHAAGLTQKQVDVVMSKYFELAPKLVAGAAQYDANSATAELKKTWATDADFKRNIRNAFVGASAIGAKAGMTAEEIMQSPLGNDPRFLRLMAAIGPEFAEDVPPGGETMVTEDDVNTLMRSEAYTNPKHADHAKVSAKVKAYYDRKYGTEAAA